MSIVKNAGFLYLIKIVNLCSPLMLIPLLTYSLSIEDVGKLFYYQSVAILGSLIIEYGFNLTGTRAIAQSQSDEERYSVFTGIISAKILLIAPLLALFVLIGYFTKEEISDNGLLFLAFLSSFMQGMSLSWYFHGIEKMKKAAKYDIASTLIYLFGAVLLVIITKEAYVVILMQLVARTISYSSAHLHVIKLAIYNGYKLSLSLSSGIREIKLGFPLFTFRIASSLYTKSTTIILGWLGPASAVAVYSGAEKITKGVGGLSAPINQAIFPNISKLIVSDVVKAKELFKKYAVILILITMIMSTSLGLFAGYIVYIVFGDGYELVINIIKILCFSLPMLCVSNLFGIQLLLPLKKNREFNFVIYSAAFLHVVMIYFVINKFGYIGAAWQVVIIESYVAIAMVFMSLTRTNFWNENV